MAEQFDSLNEKTKNIETSLKYTDGDMEKAKAMASGQYNDVILVKGKFLSKSSGRSGLFFAFFNISNEYIASIDSVLSSSSEIFEKIRIFDDWKSLYSDMKSYKKSDNTLDIQSFTDYFLDSLIGYDVFPYVTDGDLDELTKDIREILTKSFNDSEIQCQVEMEPTNSLMMETMSIPIDSPGGAEIPDEAKDDVAAPVSEEDKKMAKIEESANFVISGKAIVSPVKGKYINDVDPGEKIMVLLSKNDPVSNKIIKVMEAEDTDGNIHPVKGRIKEKIPMEKGGYILYALVAKGVLSKIIEEENVKIRIDNPEEKKAQNGKSVETKNSLIIGLLIFLIIVAIIIVYNLI